MRSIMFAVLSLLTLLPLGAQDAGAQKKFAGTWEAKWKDKVICILMLKGGRQISGETVSCYIQVDANGDLQDPESTEHTPKPAPILNAKLLDNTLTFEEKDGDDVMKFEMKLTADGRAELRILDAPVPIKPIRFDHK